MKVLEFTAERPETLLFLHGGSVAGWMWGEQVPAFGDHRILVPDLPGFGDSNDEPWISIDDTADRVADVLGGRPAHVVGLSLGSSVALSLAARHPEVVSSLFLASAQVTRPLLRDRMLVPFLLRMWEQPKFWQGLARSYGLAGEDAELFVSTGLGIRRETAVAIYREVTQGVPAAVLERVTAPTLAVAGERDSRAVWRDSLAAVAAGIPNSLVAIAPNMHHQWNIESVQLFNRALRTWLEARAIDSELVTAPE